MELALPALLNKSPD